MKIIIYTFLILIILGCDSNRSDRSGIIKDSLPQVKKMISETEKANDSVVDIVLFKNERCNIQILSYVDKNINNLSADLVFQFLYTFSDNCKNNVEYMEYSNELLFRVLQTYPEDVAKWINNEKLNKKTILGQLKVPINDAIDVSAVINKVEHSNIDSQIKTEFLLNLKTR